MRYLHQSFSIIAIASTFAIAATITPKMPSQDTDKCYKISSPEELYGFAAMVNGDGGYEPQQGICGKLMKDITINTHVLKTANGESNVSEKGTYTGDTSRLISWVPMGSYEKHFYGTFKGQGNTIRGLYFNDDTVYCAGLFKFTGEADHSVIIDNLGIEDAYFRGDGDIAGFVGYAYDSLTLSEDHFAGVVVAANHSGSFVGFSQNSGNVKVSKSNGKGTIIATGGHSGGLVSSGFALLEIEDSYFIGDVKGGNNVGGLVGNAYGPTTISKSYFMGNIDATGDWVGGLCGYASGTSTIITDSYAEANIKAAQEGGGLVGSSQEMTVLKNCYFKGNVNVEERFAGGIVGHGGDSLLILNSHAEIEDFYTKEFGGGLVGQMVDEYLEITDSYANGDVKGVSYLGGLASQTPQVGVIVGSYHEGDVKATGTDAYGVGGLVGMTYYAFSIKESYSIGNVEGVDCVGGLIGLDHDSSTVVNSYSVGNVNGGDNVGGLVGCVNKAKVLNSYALGSVTASSGDAGALFGEISKENVTSDNLFYLEDEKSVKIDKDMEGTHAVSSDEFVNGSLAFRLREFESSDEKIKGNVWGQNFSGKTPDEFPVLTSGIIYPIKAELNGGSVKGGMAESYKFGSKFTFPTPTREHYAFKGWYTDASFAEGTEITEISATNKGLVEAYAKWQVLRYKIEVSTNDSSMGTLVGAGTYDYGYELALKAVAKAGYQFSSWTDDVDAPAERKVVVTGATTYTANFEVVLPSSSSEKQVSSSKDEAESSSSAKVKSGSSSSKKINKSSSSGKDAIVASAQLPQFSVTVANRLVQIDGVAAGSKVTLLDMQGRVLAQSIASASSLSMVAPRAGTYLLRFEGTTRTLRVK